MQDKSTFNGLDKGITDNSFKGIRDEAIQVTAGESDDTMVFGPVFHLPIGIKPLDDKVRDVICDMVLCEDVKHPQCVGFFSNHRCFILYLAISSSLKSPHDGNCRKVLNTFAKPSLLREVRSM